jgi:electron transfer flavoprotein-quinone oxidoreductase
MTEKFSVIIVGAGLAGLSAAYSLASDGIETLVVERGDYPGAKNVTGGRIYLNPVRKFLPGIWKEAPLEREVTKEILTLMGKSSSISIELSSQKFSKKPSHSFTIQRSKFDRWLSEKATEKGALIVTKKRVDDLIKEDKKVKGIIVDGDEILADVVLATDGVMSLMAEKAGLKEKPKSANFAIGVKEIIELPREVIENRFNLSSGEGVAQLFVGSARGLSLAGFLYTNLDSLSLGIVVRIKDMMEARRPIEVYRLLEEIKGRPEIGNLIKGGNTIEYAAHVIPEGGLSGVPKLFSDGILVAGDAAGFALSTGLNVRGMEFAIASGILAAQAIKGATERNDFSTESLSAYEDLLKESFVLKDFNTFKNAPQFLNNPRIFNLYPETVCSLFEELMFIDEKPKRKLSTTVRRGINTKTRFLLLKDLIGALKV